MIYRIGLLFLLTGAAHLFAIFGLKFIAGQGDLAGVAGIGKAEVLIQLLISIIGFGMQTEGLRTLAFASDWKQKLDEIQTARLTLAGMLMLGVVGVVYDSSFWCFLVAPVLGASCDYVLYARGRPVFAGVLALVRVAVPLGTAMAVAGAVPTRVPETFLVAFFTVYLVTNLVIARALDIPAWWRVRFSSVALYLKTIPLGVINLGFYFFGLGLLFFAEFLFVDAELAVVYMALKFYVVYRGALRVIQQAYINQLNNAVVGLRVDQISMVMALGLFGSVTIFPESFISLFFGGQFVVYRGLFLWLGVAAAVASVLSSVSTSALLQKLEIPMMRWVLASVIFSLTVLVGGYWLRPAPEVVLVALAAGELLLAIGLARLLAHGKEFRDRVMFLLKNSTALLVPGLGRFLFSDSLVIYLSGFALMAGLLLAVNYTKFFKPVAADDNR